MLRKSKHFMYEEIDCPTFEPKHREKGDHIRKWKVTPMILYYARFLQGNEFLARASYRT